jgi:hypothetical protein
VAAFHDIAVTSAPKKSKEEREMVDTATASIKAIMRTREDFYAFLPCVFRRRNSSQLVGCVANTQWLPRYLKEGFSDDVTVIDW